MKRRQVLLVIILALLSWSALLPPRPLASDPVSWTAPITYPRLANYNGLQHAWQVPFVATDDLVIARRGAPIAALRRANPHVLTLLYERTLQVDLCCTQTLYGLTTAQIPARWWLLQAGSTLAQPLTATWPWITVRDPRPFARCQDLLVGSENMHVWRVQGHRLYVRRGYFSQATAHPRNTPIAPHYSYRHDLSNCRIAGRGAAVRPWSFNLASTCPRWHGWTWTTYLAHYVAAVVRREGWGGVFYDNLLDLPPSALVDVNGDGRADGGLLDGVTAWRAGERALLTLTRRLLPGQPVVVNGDLLLRGLAVGREMEAFPTIPGTAVSAALDTYLADGSAGSPLTIVNPDSVDRPIPSMPAVELAVGAALLGSGYAAYDHGWLDHGTPWWFDEYDGGQGSALVHRVDAATTVLPVVHVGRFRRGDVVLLDAEAARVQGIGPQGLVVQRGVLGTPARPHAARTVVTTLAQRRAGRGYLGPARGPARLIATAPWTPARTPLELQRGPSRVNGHVQRAPAVTLEPSMALQVVSGGHYDPRAVRATLLVPPTRQLLRTLVFAARGPAGQRLWVFAGGHAGYPLTLQAQWRRYVLPIGRTSHILLAAGQVCGVVNIRHVQFYMLQAFVWRRDFARGVVVVNPTDTMQRVDLGQPYRLLAGDQNPWANSGRVVRTVAVARYRATILVRSG